jgi:hypothetical protein
MNASGHFSSDYATACARFREAAASAGARLESISLAAKGPAGESLGIDVAWLGAEQPRRVLLHTSGLHGVEGFAGSAIQLALLDSRPHAPADAAIVFLHVLNPFGMAWLRRFNESNVDLNRNFLAPHEEFAGVAEAYRRLNELLNPANPPRRIDLFLPRAGAALLRHGFQNLKQAIAEGQYEFPRGLFFGGRQVEESAAAVLAWAKSRLAGVKEVFVIDIHTGLGRRGEDTFLTEYDAASERARRLRDRLGSRVHTWSKTGVAYRIRGGFLQALERELAGVEVTAVCQEFGTYPAVNVLYSLREENRLHHWGDAQDMEHAAKRRLLGAFCPADPSWRRKIVERGEQLFTTVLNGLS